MITQTLVFQFETVDQRHELLASLSGMMLRETLPRISAMSMDDEQTRAGLMVEALERYSDSYELRNAIEALAEASDLHLWSWEKYDGEA